MLIKFNSVIKALEVDYLNDNGFYVDERTRPLLNSAVVYAIESYLYCLGFDCAITGSQSVKRYSASTRPDDIAMIISRRINHEWGSLGRGILKTWICDFEDIVSSTINHGNVQSVSLHILCDVGVKIRCQYT